MTRFLFILSFISISLLAYGQQFDRCATHNVIMQNDTRHNGYKQQVDATFQFLKQYSTTFASNRANGDTIYRVPVVFHVVYENAAENINDSLLMNQIEVLNQDYRRRNADTNLTRAVFDTLAGDAQIEFYLAYEDPQGNPTRGITRTPTTETNFGIDLFSQNLDKVKFDSTGGKSSWPTDKYLNIWVCDLENPAFPLGQVLGFAYPPSCAPNWPQGQLPTDPAVNGVVVHYKVLGRNNPLSTGSFAIADKGRTATHEVGHYMGLRHIWGDGQGAIFGGVDCSADDGIADTPNAGNNAQQQCNYSKNTCVDTPFDYPDMIENYMDYAEEGCMNMFTHGQIEIMRASLATCRNSIPRKPVEGQDNSALNDTITLNAGDTISVNPGDTVFLANGSFVIADSKGGVLYHNNGSVWVDVNGSTDEVNSGNTFVYILPFGQITATIDGAVFVTVTDSICPGESLEGYTMAGTYIDTFLASNGSDSIRTLELTILPVPEFIIDAFVCFGDNLFGYNTSGTFVDTFTAANGCDSLRILNLIVRPQNVTNFAKTICPGSNYEGYTTGGIYTDTFTDQFGCDSVRTVDLSVQSSFNDTITLSICFGDTYYGYGSNGIYIDTFSSPNCDSIRVLDLTVLSQNTSSISETICDGEVFEGYTTGGTFVDTLTDQFGCDSIRTLNLTVLPNSTLTIDTTVCFGETVEGYTATGVYLDTFQAGNTCDSVRIIDLTVLPQNTASSSATICDGDTLDGYFETGVYVSTLTAADGCDSLHTLNLTVLPPPTKPQLTLAANNTLTVPNTYDSYYWYEGSSLVDSTSGSSFAVSTSGSYQVVVTDDNGCTVLSDPLQVTISGIATVESISGFSYYPNPANNILNLENISPVDLEISLFNSIGKLSIKHIAYAQKTTQIDMSELIGGVYLIKVNSIDATSTYKLIIVD